MRKIVVLSFVSLDGVMQAPGGPEEDTSGDFQFGGWTVPYWDDFSNKIMGEQMGMPFDLLLGRKTYDIFAGYWPKQKGAIADPFNITTKYVVSGSSPKLTWENSVLIDGDVVAKLQELKQQDGSMLQVHGSGTLTRWLIENDLVDEMNLLIVPVVVGQGIRLFPDSGPDMALDLVESRAFPKGITLQVYRPNGRPQYAT